MKKNIWILFLLLWAPGAFCAPEKAAAQKSAQETAHEHVSMAEVRKFLKHVFDGNAKYASRTSDKYFLTHSEEQKPRATVVTCSDSRVQSESFHSDPTNDLFFIRNIGNQIESTQGSVAYGIYHLHTPILLIVGHSQCGAVKAGQGDYSNELP